jgi:hypothetical protein
MQAPEEEECMHATLLLALLLLPTVCRQEVRVSVGQEAVLVGQEAVLVGQEAVLVGQEAVLVG